MVGVSPITVAFLGVFLGFWVEGMAFLGVYPDTEEAGPVNTTLATSGFLLAGLSLLFGVIWLLIGTRPAGDAAAILQASQTVLLFTGVMATLAFVFIPAGIAQLRGWSLAPIGGLCWAAVIVWLLVALAMLPVVDPRTGNGIGFYLSMLLFLILFVAFTQRFRGRLGGKPVGVLCILVALASLWVALGFMQVVPFLSLSPLRSS